MERDGWFERLKRAIKPTRDRFLKGCSSLFKGSFCDEAMLEGFEEALIASDVGVRTTQKIIARIREMKTPDPLHLIKEEISSILSKTPSGLKDISRPMVIMVIGVNGVGKTTTIAKLAYRFKGEGKGVILACGDTFRPAAEEQLQIWAERLGMEMVSQNRGADSAAVVFDALSAAMARGRDVVIIDTAGRMHSRINLIEELKKIYSVCASRVPGAPHEVLLVLDATFGQNGISQAELFTRELGVTGIVLSKLDGTAKGGVVIAIADRLNIPVKFIGVGEGLEDLLDFSGEEFSNALFGNW